MGVWAWDQEGLLPGNNIPGSYIKVYTSEKFNFPSDGFVKGDVVHVGQRNTRDLQLRNATYEERSTFADAGPFLDVSDGVTPGGEPPLYVYPDDAVDRVRNIMLYFTDNRNEPKKLDVFKVMSMSLQALEKKLKYHLIDRVSEGQLKRAIVTVAQGMKVLQTAYTTALDALTEIENTIETLEDDVNQYVTLENSLQSQLNTLKGTYGIS